MHAYLCVNNSYSGSKVTGNGFPAASSIERISRLKTAYSSPDYILVYIGVNDFGNGVKIRRDRVTYTGNKNLLYFEDAYEYMVSQMQEQYPEAKIICGTLLRSKVRNHEDWIFPESYAGVRFEDYNDAIRRITKQKNILLADTAKQNIRYETLDGTHPTAEGHKTIAYAWIKCLMGREVVQGQNYETIQR
jgi:lysophospholipase L1-like esterase